MSLTQSDCYQLARSAGLGESQAKMAAAIAMVESGGDPNAHNATPPDDSYGLWQINMLGAMGPERRKQFGISDNSQLYDPAINAKAMALISQNGGNFSPWSTYPAKATAYMNTHLLQTDGKGPDSSNGGVGGLLDGILPGSPVQSVDKLVEMFNKTAGWISDSDNWLRVGYVVGGGVIVIVGLSMVLSGTKVGNALGTLAPTPGGVTRRSKVVTGAAGKVKTARTAANKAKGAVS